MSENMKELIMIGVERGIKLAEERAIKLGEERGERRGELRAKVEIIDSMLESGFAFDGALNMVKLEKEAYEEYKRNH